MSEKPIKTKTAVIIGAGPAGLTAALELLRHTDITPIILEKSSYIGGISRTVEFGENKMDIGGHRFFSKSDVINSWWLEILPLEAALQGVELTYQSKKHHLAPSAPAEDADEVMLVRKRKSRIFFDGSYYDYPITLSFSMFKNLGLFKILKIGWSYVKSSLFPVRNEKTLEDFFINRFGTELYTTFFKTYTEKVWGMPCSQIGADWGRQRIKGLSVRSAVSNSITRLFRKVGFRQKGVETSLIEYFLYPKYGPGHLWESVARQVEDNGGALISNATVVDLDNTDGSVKSVSYEDGGTGQRHTLEADYFFSTMPIPELFASFSVQASQPVHDAATKLQFRDFITVGLLVEDAKLEALEDNWIYIHDPHVKVGRIQFFRNWSPFLVKTQGAHVLGFEYFCTEGDALWSMSTQELGALASRELAQLGISQKEVRAFHVEKVAKAYPVYTGSYEHFSQVQEHLNSVANLYPIGRNGMHRYNNQDHSMLTAIASVESILGTYKKEDVWSINTEEDYHEEK